MRRLLVNPVAAACFVLAFCATADGSRLRTVRGGCGGTKLLRGTLPKWTAPAMADSGGGPPPWPFALSRRRNVVALVFGYPLRAGTPTGRMNKVLWIMRLPRNGLPLHVTAHPLSANRPLVKESLPADSSPGQIYPSYLDVPKPGCWRITLRWAGHSDQIALRYS